jgi:hypothetical protein
MRSFRYNIMTRVLFIFTIVCISVSGCFLLLKGIWQKKVFLILVGLIFISIVLGILYLGYTIQHGHWGFG